MSNNDWWTYLSHSGVKGMTWKEHKYISKSGSAASAVYKYPKEGGGKFLDLWPGEDMNTINQLYNEEYAGVMSYEDYMDCINEIYGTSKRPRGRDKNVGTGSSSVEKHDPLYDREKISLIQELYKKIKEKQRKEASDNYRKNHHGREKVLGSGSSSVERRGVAPDASSSPNRSSGDLMLLPSKKQTLKHCAIVFSDEQNRK